MRSAIKQARAPRGTDDAGNCWFADQRPSGELSHARVLQEPPEVIHSNGDNDPDAMTEETPKQHNDDNSSTSGAKSVFTLLSSPGLSKQVEDHLVEAHMDQCVVDCALQEDLDSVSLCSFAASSVAAPRSSLPSV